MQPLYQYDVEQMNFSMFNTNNASNQHANCSNNYINSSGGMMQYEDISPMLYSVDRGPKEGDFGFLLDLSLDGHELLANL